MTSKMQKEMCSNDDSLFTYLDTPVWQPTVSIHAAILARPSPTIRSACAGGACERRER